MIKYKDLSAWLKAVVIATWIMGAVWAFSFIVGFIYGVLGYM